MIRPTLLVPRGAEAAAVRRAHPNAPIVEFSPGARSAELPVLPHDAYPVVLGLCGALGALRVGDAVLYRNVRDESGTYPCDETLAHTLRLPLVDACTTDHVVTTRRERDALAQRYHADVVDMEGTHVAATLLSRRQPCTMLRVVSDDPTRDLPALERAIVDGRVDSLRIALAFVRAPSAAYAFIRDVRRALTELSRVAANVSRGSG